MQKGRHEQWGVQRLDALRGQRRHLDQVIDVRFLASALPFLAGVLFRSKTRRSQDVPDRVDVIGSVTFLRHGGLSVLFFHDATAATGPGYPASIKCGREKPSAGGAAPGATVCSVWAL